jgi:hypothetical protein
MYASLCYSIACTGKKRVKTAVIRLQRRHLDVVGHFWMAVALKVPPTLYIQGSLVVFSSVSVSERSVSYQNTFKMGYKKTTKHGFSEWKCSLAIPREVWAGYVSTHSPAGYSWSFGAVCKVLETQNPFLYRILHVGSFLTLFLVKKWLFH